MREFKRRRSDNADRINSCADIWSVGQTKYGETDLSIILYCWEVMGSGGCEESSDKKSRKRDVR
jgi:hypothetical protein